MDKGAGRSRKDVCTVEENDEDGSSARNSEPGPSSVLARVCMTSAASSAATWHEPLVRVITLWPQFSTVGPCAGPPKRKFCLVSQRARRMPKAASANPFAPPTLVASRLAPHRLAVIRPDYPAVRPPCCLAASVCLATITVAFSPSRTVPTYHV